MSKPNRYLNPMYDHDHGNGQDRIQKRRAWLHDKMTQMGHHPDKYQKWHEELKTLKQKPKHAKQEPVVRLDNFVVRHAAVLKDQASLRSCTDYELEILQKFVNDEISRRGLARHRIKMQRVEEILLGYKKQGWLPEHEALVEVRRVIVQQKIFGLGKKRAAKDLSDQIIRAMWRGDKQPWDKHQGIGAMPRGYFGYEPGKKSKTHYYLDPKQLLCHVIAQWKYQSQRKRQQVEAAAERKRFHEAKLKEWEEKNKQRSQQVAQGWHQQISEQNSKFRQALVKHEQVKEENRRARMYAVAMETQRLLAKHGINTIPVPTDEPAQSLPNTDHKGQNG